VTEVVAAEQCLERNFVDALRLPEPAVLWLLDLWRAIQVLDDVADGEAVDRQALDEVIWAVLVDMPGNTFFQAQSANLLPAVATAILKWKASDVAEREGRADEKSFVWRAAYYDIILLTVSLCHGPRIAMTMANSVMAMYGETFADYRKEFANA
jgi:hypothetical protein